MKEHRIKWFVVLPSGERLRHTAQMRGTWGYDVTCSCGWDSRVGGGTLTHIRDRVWEHKFDATHGLLDSAAP